MLFVLSACQTETRFVAVELEDTETTSQQTETDSASDLDDDTGTGSESVAEDETDSGSTADTDTSDTEDTQPAESDSNVTTDDTESDTGTETGSEMDTSTTTASETETDSCTSCGLPESFDWESSPPIILPAEGDVQIKDPTAVYYEDDDKWLVYATTRHEEGSADGQWGMTYLSVADWELAGTATHTSVGANNPELASYNVSPQLFYFSEDGLWYLIYQTQDPAYSTSSDPTDVASWSAPEMLMTIPKDFFEAPDSNYGIDYWVICDNDECFLFFSALNNILYMVRTPRMDFPNGFAESEIEIAMHNVNYNIFQGCSVYTINNDEGTTYLLIGMAFSGIRHYFGAWTSDSLGGNDWNELAVTEAEAFASLLNVTWIGEEWAADGIYQGEMLRANPDETMTIDTSDMRFLYQGLVSRGASESENEYGLGLLTYKQ